jgi:predicted amidohydrolase YtcJ
VQALAVRDGKIVAVGSDSEIRALAGSGTQVVDLKGRTVLPGLNDTHVHFDFGEPANDPIRFDFRSINSLKELQKALRDTVAKVPAGQWIVGRISEVPFPEEKLFTREDIDKVSGDHPVALPRGPHIWVVNSKALQLAKITADTPQPPGGVIVKDAKGQPTGVLRESNAQRMVGALIPPEPALDDATAEENLRQQLRLLVSLGITSGNVAGLRPGDDFRRTQNAYRKWGSELPRMTLQLRVYPGFDRYDDAAEGVRETLKEIDALSFHTGFGGDRIKIGAIKMSVDGGFTGQAAAMLVPYPDGRTGNIRIPREALYEVSRYAHDRGWQLGIHSIGDGGVQLCVDVLEQVLRDSPRADHRHYIHHVSMKPPEATIKKMADLGIMVSSQANFTYDLASYYKSATSGVRLATNNPQRSLMDAGVKVAYGSDHRPYGPIIAIWAAVTREGRDGAIYGLKEEGISLQDAIRNHTVNSAYLTFDEDNRGSLEPGKFADMVVLTEDIMTIEPKRIRDIGIVQTIIDGKIVYTAKEPLIARFDNGEIWKAPPAK